MAGIDATGPLKRLGNISKGMAQVIDRVVNEVADEALRLSSKEVPHDEGTLQGSGNVRPLGNLTYQVGFHTVYAARLHEHPEYRFQKGRKGKYLEDPIKQNTGTFLRYFRDQVEQRIERL